MNLMYFARWTITLLLLVFFSLANAQVKLKVLDQKNKLPIEDAIAQWNGGQALSNSNGVFIIPEKVYQITVSRIGYIQQAVDLTSFNVEATIFMVADASFQEVVVTAYPIATDSYAAPASYTFIPEERIRIANNVEYGDVLNNVPGVFMHTGTLGTNRITIRGIGARTPFSTNRIRAYYNEIPLTAGDGETSLEDNELSTLGSIEVIKGPSATSYGAGLAGLIKLTPSKSRESFIASSYGIGSFGLSRSKFEVQVAQDNHLIHSSYANTFSEGFRENNQYNRDNFTINYQYSGKKVSIDFLSTFITVKGFIPSSLNETDFRENPSVAAANWQAVRGFEDYTKGLLGTTLTYSLNETSNLSGTLYTTFRDNFELRPFGILTENSALYGSRWKYSNEISQSIKIAAGGEYTVEDFELTTLDQEDREPTVLTSFNQQLRKSLNLFTEATWEASERINIIGGLNYSRINYDLTDLFRQDGDQSGEYSFDGVLSPRLYIGYSTNNNQTLYAQISRGFSAPSVEETLTPDGQINTDIAPETGYNFEIGSRGTLGNFSYKANVYHLAVRNLLVARRTAEDQSIGINAGKTTHQGFEAEINYRKKIGAFQLKPFVNFTINSIEFNEFIDLEEDFSGNNLPGIPSFTGNLGLFVATDFGFYSNVNLRAVGEMFLRDDNLLNSDPYTLLNLKVGYQKTFGKISLDINGGVNNLLDEAYASQILINAGSFGGRAPRYFYPGNPRNYYGNISIKYSLGK